MLMGIKRILNRFGFDIKKHHPVFETTIRPLGIKTVVDIGANEGHYARDIRKLLPDAFIYSFEPLKDCFANLKETMKEDPRFESFNIALSDQKGEKKMRRSSFHPSSSLLPMSELHKKLYPKSAGSVEETIHVERLDDVMFKKGDLEPILVKIDVQGYEDRVIRGGREFFKRAAAIQVETSFVTLYEGQPLFGDVYALLSELGFSYYGDMGRHYSRENGRLIYEDSLFIKRELMRV